MFEGKCLLLAMLCSFLGRELWLEGIVLRFPYYDVELVHFHVAIFTSLVA